MPELDLSERHDRSGFQFESPQLDMKIYRLITTVAGSYELAERVGREEEGQKWEWFKRAEIPELSRLLVSIAAICRSNIDAFDAWSDLDEMEIDAPVGILYPDLSEPENDEELGFRSACNKILHTDRFNPDVEDPARGMDSALRPLIHLYGQYHGDNWKAILQIYRFAIQAGSFI
jgi:hypothetical protein